MGRNGADFSGWGVPPSAVVCRNILFDPLAGQIKHIDSLVYMSMDHVNVWLILPSMCPI